MIGVWPAQALVERILHFEGFYFNNKTLDMAVVNPNGFQVPLARPPWLPACAAHVCMLQLRACCDPGALSNTSHGLPR